MTAKRKAGFKRSAARPAKRKVRSKTSAGRRRQGPVLAAAPTPTPGPIPTPLPTPTPAPGPTPTPLPIPMPAPAPTERKKLAAADFYGALQRTLDATQRQLSSANNAFADFVVKEFKIDAAVQVSLNELGILQLTLADDTMAAQSVSRVSLTLAAVAKITEQSSSNSVVKADVTPLAELAWLPPQLVALLAQYEVKTASEFLGLVADARFSTQIASLLKITREDIGRWSNQMRLLELPGMTTEGARVLGELGVGAVADLAKLDDKALAEFQKKAAKTFTEEVLTKLRDTARKASL